MFLICLTFFFGLSRPPHAKSWLIGKDSDAGRDWGQEEKGTTEDEMAGWHHQLNGHGFGWTLGVGDGQGGLACCGSWGHKESDTAERLNWTKCRRLRRHWFNPWIRKIFWRRKWQSTPAFLPGKSHGQRSLVGYSPWGHKESDTTEQLSMSSNTVWWKGHLKTPLSSFPLH